MSASPFIESLGHDKIHVRMHVESDSLLVERLGEATRLKIETKKRLSK